MISNIEINNSCGSMRCDGNKRQEMDCMRTNDTPILDLMKDIDKGNIQLPDFQRGWVWDDSRIRELIASITQNFPVGAAMFLEYGNANVRFKG